MKKLLFLLICLGFVQLGFAQDMTVEELKAQKAEKQAQIDALTGEVNAIDSKIKTFPGWKFGSLGLIGANFSGFNDWLGRATPNTFTGNIGFSANAFANLDREKFFWRNSGNLNIAWTKLDTDTNDDVDADFESTTDAINISSLYGYKLTEKIAISALGEYRSTIIDNFNNPGFLDIGVGATWTPITDLVVVFHPLNYNIVFSDSDFSYSSSLGCKIVADYARSLPMGVSWRSNLSAFVSYSDPNNFSNWTWVNGFSFNVWKGIGVGLEVGLRGNKQEGYNAFLLEPENVLNGINKDNFDIDELDSDNNPLQSYWLLGLTYTL